ncbi:MAG: hypothetical protein GXP14_05840 [Gammaproteobacteria bacterium]|nr:hypothetical protein [Gammaproteobacteria bacterium]
MHKLFVIFFISSAVVLFNGCASMSQPERAAYTGADNIGAIKPEILIGNWNIKLLNPVEGEEMQKLISTYKSDGTVVMKAQSSASNNPMGNIVLEMTGTWSIEGEHVVLQLDSIRETSGNAIASLMVGMLGNMKKSLSGTANIYEASVDRIVLVSTEGGQAQEWTRIP